MSGAALAAGLAADALLGDPRRGHPVAGFGQVAGRVERTLYAPTRPRGAAYTVLLVGAAGAGAAVVSGAGGRAAGQRGRHAVLAVVTWGALGGRSLTAVAGDLAGALERGDVDAARALLPSLCGRDPSALDASGLARATVESVAENTSDAVVATLLWGALGGPVGVVVHRAANTLDAMVGHRSERYAQFGWASARLDDALNWPAARLTAVLTALCAPVVGGAPDTAWETVLRDGAQHPSPNAGRAEAAFAGALGVTLGGPVAYGGRTEVRPQLGDGPAPGAGDVHRAVRLSRAVGVAALLACVAARTFIDGAASALLCPKGGHRNALGAGPGGRAR